MASRLQATLSLVFLTLAVSLAATTAAVVDAPSPAPPPPLNLTDILKNATHYNTFIRLLKDTEVTSQVTSLLDNDRNADGLTILAPTDAAFGGLKSGTLNRMDAQEKSELVLFHILPKYNTFVTFETTTNPVRTQASGQHGVCTVNVTTGDNQQVNISSGLMETTLGSPLYSQFPLAVYPMDKVLLPSDLFGPNAKDHGAEAPAPAAMGKPGKKTPSSSEAGAPDEAPSTEADTKAAAAADRRTGWPALAAILSAVALRLLSY